MHRIGDTVLGSSLAHSIIFLRLESIYSTVPSELYAAAWLMAEGGRGGQTTEAARTHAQTRRLQARSRGDDVESLDKQRCWSK